MPFASSILALTRLVLIMTLILVLLPFQFLVVHFAPQHYSVIPRLFHGILTWLIGLKIEQRGHGVSTEHPTLFISNHCSYLDIIILSGFTPVSFVAKSEIASWPLIGTLARLQQTVFVNRRRANAGQHVDAVTQALRAGRNLVIFPEGTSGDGSRVMPFKPTLFRVADITVDGHPVAVQPVSITLSAINGLPAGRYERPLFCWYGDMALGPHLWTLLGLGSLTVTVEFFPILRRNQFESHKDMAQYCHKLIADSVSAAITGKPTGPRELGIGNKALE